MRRLFRIFILLFLLMGGGLFAFYAHYQLLVERLNEERHIGVARANAVKHAYTAAQIYTGLRYLGVDADSSEAVVLFLGRCNEYAEQVVRYVFNHKRDTIPEMVKDMRNNQIGVTAARWLEAHRLSSNDQARLELMVQLSQNGLLIIYTEGLGYTLTAPLSEGLENTGKAIAQAKMERAGIIAETEKVLAKLQP